MDAIVEIDSEIVLWLNQWAGRSAFLDSTVKLVVSDYFVPVSMALCLLAMWFVGKDSQTRNAHQRAVLTALIAVAFANLLVLILNQYYFRDRPFFDHELTLLFYQPTDSSFPSNPAAVGFAMAAGMWHGSRKLGLVLFCAATLWGLSRTYSGLFYPSDVIAGALIGVGMSQLVAVALRLIEPIPSHVLRVTRKLHLA